ncbi:hypothetical protein HK100_004959 [Physocladia obscura]|uniref:Uncharacterized protein n=1 Tax=Physocladia obscura TaxID=109957 RepID=A0AAD5T6R3_9FUNG|nr:hypothetical protein HK100_004959 [Physocladia obscura]
MIIKTLGRRILSVSPQQSLQRMENFQPSAFLLAPASSAFSTRKAMTSVSTPSSIITAIRTPASTNSESALRSLRTLSSIGVGSTRMLTARHSFASTTSSLATTPTTTYIPPPPRGNRFFAILGKVFFALLLLPGLIAVIFPSLLAFIIPATTLLLVGFTLLLSAAVVLGVVLPVLLAVAVAFLIPAIIVVNELSKLRKAKSFDSAVWDITTPSRNFHIDDGTLPSKKKHLKVEVESNNSDSKIVFSSSPVSQSTQNAIDFFIDIGAVVESEIMRRDLLGQTNKGGHYGNVVALKGRNVGTFGPLMAKIEIPIDRSWIRAQLAERKHISQTKN